jgi:hydroxyethylthiazole kinase-like uncharacterized protein yjeF
MKPQKISRALAKSWLPHRRSTAHKGSVGRVYIMAGSRGMIGASILAALGAVKGGAGLVRLGVPKSLATTAARRAPLEVTIDALPEDRTGKIDGGKFSVINRLLAKYSPDVVAIGPGLGVSPGVHRLVKKIFSLKTALVLDADALNVLAPLRGGLPSGRRVVTPHPGELSRLIGAPVSAIQKNRLKAAAAGAEKIGGVCLLKGSGTVVSDGQKIFINTTGNPQMASGGMGDLLTGLIAALWGQMEESKGLQAAALGAYLHGLAGDLADRKRGGLSLMASEVAREIPAATNLLRRGT